MPEPTPAAPPAPGAQGRRRKTFLIALAAALLVPAVAWLAWRPAAALWRRGEDRFRQWRIQRFLTQAGDAIRTERPHVARAALDSAAALAPGDWGIRIARADALLRTGAVPEALALWEEWLATAPRDRPALLSYLYASRLVSTGGFARLAELACRELDAGGPDFGIWLNAAAESARLAGAAGLRTLGTLRDADAGRLASAYVLARTGRPAEAAESLRRSGGKPLPPALALLGARAWVAAGDVSEARRLLARASRVAQPTEILAEQFVTGDVPPELARRHVRGLLAAGMDADVRRRGLFLLLLHSLPWADPGVAEDILQALGPLQARLDPSLLATLWLHAALAGAQPAELFWRERLQQRTANVLPEVSRDALTPGLAGILCDRAPLPLELVWALLSQVNLRSAGDP